MTKDEAVTILRGGKHYNSVQECQAELAEIADMIEGMTEVVRCKNCKNREYCKILWELAGDWIIYENGDWFCADGERKEGEQSGSD